MKSLTEHWISLARQLSLAARVDTRADIKTVSSRSAHEGDGFVTITLPVFRKHFERWLADGRVSSRVPGFKLARGGLPAFLRGYTRLLFAEDGALLPCPDPDIIRSVRALTGTYGKLLEVCSEERVQAAIREYFDVDDQVHVAVEQLDPAECRRLRVDFHQLWGGVCSDLDYLVSTSQLLPRHGPGATADRLTGNQKWYMTWAERLEEFFPIADYLLPNYRHFDGLHDVQTHPAEAELPARLIAVPKTQLTPRLIAVEHTALQYAQQALMRGFVESIENEKLLKGAVQFRDQSRNQKLAKLGSVDGHLATLDLSQASDRVPAALVGELFQDFPDLKGALFACRSGAVHVNGVTSPLAKFSSMGSAVTFPLEAMVFATIAFGAIARAEGIPLKTVMSRYGSSLGVYGDDIIVPSVFAQPVMERLRTFGFVINEAKSFWTGLFRESCGKEYYAGRDVTFPKMRRRMPTSRSDVSEVVSAVSYLNQCYALGWYEHADAVRASFEAQVFRLHGGGPELGALTIHHEYPDAQRWNKFLHRGEIRAYTVETVVDRRPVDDWQALLAFFLMRGNEPLQEGWLETSGRPSVVKLKQRWIRSA